MKQTKFSDRSLSLLSSKAFGLLFPVRNPFIRDLPEVFSFVFKFVSPLERHFIHYALLCIFCTHTKALHFAPFPETACLGRGLQLPRGRAASQFCTDSILLAKVAALNCTDPESTCFSNFHKAPYIYLAESCFVAALLFPIQRMVRFWSHSLPHHSVFMFLYLRGLK